MNPSQARTARQSSMPTRRGRGADTPGRGADTPGQTAGQGGRTEAGREQLVLGRYHLLRKLGSGAFGTVWLASDERLERQVAVKILPRERIVGGRFEREARAAARLAHPAIVTLYEAAVDDDGAYLVSELVRGTTLDTLLENGQLSDQDIVAVGIALCDALEHAHGEGVVHRDVKPSNVLVPARPVTPAQVAKLTDFGVARVVGGDALTLTGDVIGTLAYMAPEQAEGLQAGPAADLYSLALVLYEALTGVNPVRTTTAAHRARRLGAHLPPLRRQRRDLPRELGQGIDMALRPRPRERGTIRDLRRALVAAREHVGDEPGIVAPPWASQTHEDQYSPEDQYRHEARRADEYRHAEPTTDSGPGEEKAPAIAWPARGLAAAAAATIAGWVSVHLLGSTPLPTPLIALAAGVLVLLLPRIGWLALIAAITTLSASQGQPGLAIVATATLALPVVLTVWRSTDWPLAAGAPALGVISLAGAWPAVAARASNPWRRAALGATGWIWTVIAGLVAGRADYLQSIPGAAPPATWASSLTRTLHDAVIPIVRSGALAPTAVWALAAVVLPWLVRGRSLAFDLVRVVVWAAMLESSTIAVIGSVHGTHGTLHAPSAVIGSIAAAAVALAFVWLENGYLGLRRTSHSGSSGGQFP